MIKTNLQIKIVDNTDDMNISYKLRDTVFTKEQGVPEELDDDGLDEISTHFLLFENNIPIGTARVFNDNDVAVIGRFCVLKEYRGKGAGILLIKEIIEYCKKQKFEKIVLGAQEHAIGFYSKLGFEVYGERYMDANIPHFKMKLLLS